MMWVQARSWGYTHEDPFFGLVLPKPELINERCLTLDEMKAVIDAPYEPLGTYFWVLAETGIRCGEACGLPVRNLLLDLGGFHAFRHGNETVMDAESVPMATRQNRLGHSDARTTMRYTHTISEDSRKIAARFGELLTSSLMAMMPAGNA
jgi:integrase